MTARSAVPNLITLVRLAMTPFVIQAILRADYGVALALFIGAGVTDLLDGAAARRLKASSRSGAYLDPVADKLLLSGVYLALVWGGTVPWWFVALLLGRDLFILAGSAILMMVKKFRDFPPSVWGKACTFSQILAASAWMVRNWTPSPAMDAAATALLWISAAVTVWSGIDYAHRGTRMLKVN